MEVRVRRQVVDEVEATYWHVQHGFENSEHFHVMSMLHLNSFYARRNAMSSRQSVGNVHKVFRRGFGALQESYRNSQKEYYNYYM